MSSYELILNEYQLSCHALEIEKMRMLVVKQNLLALSEDNELILKSLSQIKTDCEFYRSHLDKSLFNQIVAADKQKILSRKKLNEFLESKKRTEEYYKMSPLKLELEKLIKINTCLEEECKRKTHLLKLTKVQYKELLRVAMETFKNKLCEFCSLILKLHSMEKSN